MRRRPAWLVNRAAIRAQTRPPRPPRLRVHRLDRPSWLLGYQWAWEITAPDGTPIEGEVAPTHGEALQIGLAALDRHLAIATEP